MNLTFLSALKTSALTLLLLSQRSLADGNGRQKVYSPTPVKGNIATHACQQLFNHYSDSEKDPDYHAALLADLENNPSPTIWAIEEGFNVTNLATNEINTAETHDPVLAGIVNEMTVARRKNRQMLDQNLVDGDMIKGPYATTNLIQFAYRIEGREYRVSIAPQDVPTGSLQIFPDGTKEMEKERHWVWFVDSFVEIDPDLIESDENSSNVSMLATEGDIEREISKNVLASIRSFNLKGEMYARPHDAIGNALLQAKHDGLHETKLPEPTYYVVYSPNTRQKIGYLLLQELFIKFQAEDPNAINQTQYGKTPETVLVKQHFKRLAHFDLFGNRVEEWIEENASVPIRSRSFLEEEQRKVNTTPVSAVSPDGTRRFISTDRPYIVNAETAEVIKVFNFDHQIKFAKFSNSGTEIFIMHHDGWLRTIDAATGEKKDLIRANEVEQIDELSEGSLALSRADGTIIIYTREPYNLLAIPNAGRIKSVIGDRIIVFDPYFGLAQIKYRVDENGTLGFDQRSLFSAIGYKFFEGHHEEAMYNRYHSHALLNETGDHYIAYDSELPAGQINLDGAPGIYRFGRNGGKLLMPIKSELADGKRVVSSRIRADDTSIVAIHEGDSIQILYFDFDGTVMFETSIPVVANAETKIVFSEHGDLMAVGCDGRISVYAVNGASFERKLDRGLQVDRVESMRFSVDSTKVLYEGQQREVRALEL